MVLILCFGFFLASASAIAAEIRLIYPRLEAGQDTFRYAADLDSSFVLGQMVGISPQDRAFCNGFPLSLSPDGAFLSYLPLGSRPETSVWSFALIIGGTDTFRLDFPYGRAPEPVETVWSPVSPPVWYEVTDVNAHSRTAVGGSYHLFPARGTPLKVVAVSDMWAEFDLGVGLTGIIERRFLHTWKPAHVTQPDEIRIGNGRVESSDSSVSVTFDVDRRPLCEASTEVDGDEFELTIFDAYAAIDRIRYLDHAREFVDDIRWSQHARGVTLTIQTGENIWHGYRVVTSDKTVSFMLAKPNSEKPGLRGKRIVLDPGHGGTADGAIGPRGAKEKDVVLNWAKVLETTLRSAGAEVVLTRDKDVSLSLPERVEQARNFDCDVFLSLHANALPDGENPFLRHGCGTYYYQTMSRPLAEIIQNSILDETDLADDGIFDANFAVVRPTDFPAILIEAAYLMHPDEELLFIDEAFLKRLSRGVSKGLQDYFSKARTR